MVQNDFSKILPMEINERMTAVSIIAIGPQLSTTIMWHMSASEFKKSIQAGEINKLQLIQKMDDLTGNRVCMDIPLSAFIGLGGKIQYNYITTDYTQIHETIIEDCDNYR